jgi:hypothetical protein
LEALRQSPFGKMTAGPEAPSGKGGNLPAAIPSDFGFILKQVRPDTDSVEMKPGGSAEVNIANGAPGLMKIRIVDGFEGVEALLSSGELKAGEKATLILRAGSQPRSGVVKIRVEQTDEIIPISVVVK